MKKIGRVGLAVFCVLLFHKPAAAQFIPVDSDDVGRKSFTLTVIGKVMWSYNRSNPYERGIGWNISAFQADRTYRAHCIGVQVAYGLTRMGSTSGTVGGEVSWSITGPALAANASYTETMDRTVQHGGFVWRCPGTASSYQRYSGTMSQSFHPKIDGLLQRVAIRACMTTDPRNTYSYFCTPWDVNDYGGN